MRIVKVGESYICPVCGKYTFEYAGDFDICPVCNWEDDLCQLENPDEEDCANHMSLNQAREAWAHGRRVYGITFEQGRNELAINADTMLTNWVTENKTVTEEQKRDLIIALITLKYTQSNSVWR